MLEKLHELFAEVSLTEQERDCLLYSLNQTRTHEFPNKLIHDQFAEVVHANPQAVAVQFEENALTYMQLESLANQLANYLSNELHIALEERIGILMNGSLTSIVAILGILKAGGAYVPVDPSLPEDRVHFIIQDAEIRVLISEERFLHRISGGMPDRMERRIIALDTQKCYYLDSECISDSMSQNTTVVQEHGVTLPYDANIFAHISDQLTVSRKISPENLAYMIYTSGTTGTPKGVLIEHRNLMNYIQWRIQEYELTPQDVTLQLISISFDGFGANLYSALLSGGRLVVVKDHERLDAAHIRKVIKEEQVTTFSIVPVLYHAILQDAQAWELKSLRLIVLAAEKAREDLIRLSHKLNPEIILINEYGPTENTVATTFYKGMTPESVAVIGKPIANTQVFILDEANHLVAPGEVGELCISGANLARGYHNRVALTRQKFISNPYLHGQRMYRTGDQVRWLPDGNIEFIGRIDHQVKIRGFRVELGEIETQLVKHPSVQDAVVIAREDGHGEKYLAAYIILQRDLPLTGVREYLNEQLPSYMVPTYFHVMKEFPLTTNGKVNRSALPEPDNNFQTGVAYVAPQNAREEQMVEIWTALLGIAQIGIHDDFFRLGGHSLKASQLIARLSREFRVTLSINDIFLHPTVQELVAYIQSQHESTYSAIEPVEEREYYPASAPQQRLLALRQLDGASVAYNIPMFWVMEGALDYERFVSAFQVLVERHDSFRTYFDLVDTLFVQKVEPHIEVVIPLRHAEKADLDQIVQTFVQPFDLSQVQLFRMEIVQYADRHLLMFDIHHTIADGFSINLLFKEMATLYEGKELPPLSIQYKDFSAWQNRLLQSEQIQEQEKYWLDLFQDEVPVLELPTDYQRPLMMRFEGKTQTTTIGNDLTQKLAKLANQQSATLYMVLLATVNVWLHKYTSQDDIIVGSPSAGRRHPDLENVFGMFVNTLPMRNHPAAKKTFLEFLAEVKIQTLTALENQDYQLDMLIDRMKWNRDLSRNPLFDVSFVLQNANDLIIQLSDLRLIPYDYQSNIAKFDLLLQAFEVEEGLKLQVEYNTHLFKASTIERMIRHYIQILHSVVEYAELPIGELHMMEETERQEILCHINDTVQDYPKQKTLVQLFEEQVEVNPSQIALVFEGQEMSYRELNERVNQLARTLQAKGIQREQIVPMLVDRSFEMLIGLWAILKAGGAYLPLNPADPDERIRYLLEDAKAELLLTQTHFIDQIAFTGDVIDLHDASAYDENIANLESRNKPGDLAYVIYTSGTTGKPKGNLTMHYNILRVVKHTNYIEITSEDRLLQLSTYAFDGSTFDFYGALLNGATLVLIRKETALDLEKLSKTIAEQRITVFFVTTALFNTLVDTSIESLATVRKILFGGERISVAHAKKALQVLGQDRLIHVYGPTESTVFATYYPVNEIEEGVETIPIGKPLANTQVYIVDQSGQLSPTGVAGEIWIGGDGLARGYLHRPELTAEKFVTNTQLLPSGERIYRTGDLGRWLPDGNIEFRGRIDQQVKIRGFRIELGEIEYQLMQIEGIREAVVIDREDQLGMKYLAAYIVSDREIVGSSIREQLLHVLPEYMIPTYITRLAGMPLTSNGKVNKRALPEPDGRGNIEHEWVAPRNEREQRMADLWAEILGVERVGLTDNFFTLGGHSLKATRLIARVMKEFHVNLQIKDIFAHVTVQALLNFMADREEQRSVSIEPVEKKASYRTSSAQKRLFALRQIEGDSITYNIPVVWVLEGELDVLRFEAVFRKLVERHEALRTCFTVIDGETMQIVRDEVTFAIPVRQIPEEQWDQFILEFIRPFDLSSPPLFRITLLESVGRYLLVLDIHHSIADGSSIDLLVKEFATLYEGKELHPLSIQYKDFSAWQNQLFSSERIRKQEQYWLNQFADGLPVLNLPTDEPRPSIMRYEGEGLRFRVGKELTREIRHLSERNGATLYMTLLAAYNVMLHKYSGQEDIVIGSPVAGRNHADLAQVFGMFINTLALRNQPQSEKTFLAFLADVKENSLAAFENQDYPFEMLVEKLHVQRDRSRNPIFDVSFIVQNATDLAVEMTYLRMVPYEFALTVAKFDLLLQVFELEEELELSLEYSIHLFQAATMERMAGHFIHLLQQIVKHPTGAISELQLITESERQQLLHSFNKPIVEDHVSQAIHYLFEEQVEWTPDQIAVVAGESALTYRELNEKANQLARRLRDTGVRSEEIVGILVEPSLEMLIGIMAILKAGGAYLPVDPAYPLERILYMLEDSEAKVLLTLQHLQLQREYAGRMVNLDDPAIYTGDATNLSIVTQSANLAYVIYTSGSTGKPKGVMVEHKSLLNLCFWHIDTFAVTAGDRASKFAGVGFDASVWEIFPYLITGATLYLIPSEMKLDIWRLNQYLEENQITISFLPTQYAEQFMQLANRSLRVLLTGGDKLKEFTPQRYRLVNNYGPTENTVVSTSYIVQDVARNIPVGTPIRNTQVYIVSRENHLQPVGVAGELCVGGVGLARGYLNQPELTQEKFVANPFLPGTRMYKTGDLARWLTDGNIEFLGRIDQQVQIRGYRVEMGEIENQLLQLTEIKEAVVLAREDQYRMNYLVAYVVSDEEISVVDLRKKLAAGLPDYMIPASFVQLAKLPVTANGKVDIKNLEGMDIDLRDTTVTYAAPQNEIEEMLISIWKAVLQVEQIGTQDHFFHLGGHSLSAVKVATQAMVHGWKVTVQDIFDYPTIQELAERVKGEQIEEPKVEERELEMVMQDLWVGQAEVASAGKEAALKNIFLTGVTGFLGIHLLEQILLQTDANVYCLIRGKSEEQSRERLIKILRTYFAGVYDSLIDQRIFVVCGDLATERFGLIEEAYLATGERIDTVLHSAALVKHFGDYADFEAINVQGTARVIAFAEQFRARLHHVSTISVSGEIAKGAEEIIFTENDFYVGQDYRSNVYVRSKFEAEKLIFQAMKDGVDASIYRVGNLTGRFRDGQFQMNIAENAFYSMLRSIINLGKISRELIDQAIEFTPIDLCAQAVAELMKRPVSGRRVFHLQNRQIRFAELVLVMAEMGMDVAVIDDEAFETYIAELVKDSAQMDHLSGLMHEYQLNAKQNNEYQGQVRVDSSRTVRDLGELCFEWPGAGREYLRKVLEYMREVGFI